MLEVRADNPMKIAIFTEAWPPIVSGVAVATRTLVEGLRQRGHTVHVYAPHHPGQPAHEEHVFRLPSVPVPLPGWIPISLPLNPLTMDDIVRRDYDVAHTQHPFLLGMAARRLARRADLPLVVTVHTQYEQYVHYWTPWHEPGRRVVRQIIREFCNTCDHVTTVAAGMEAMLREYGVRRPISVIPNDVDLDDFLAADGAGVRDEWGIAPGEAFLLSVSRLASEKNLLFLLESISPTLRNGPPARLVFVGDGPLRPELERRARQLGVSDRVLFPGWVNHAALPRCFAAADIFLLASTTEVNPLTIRESLAAGTPVVAVDSFSAREGMVDEHDGLITPFDPDAFRRATETLISNSDLRARLSAGARETARQRGAGGAARRTEDVYRGLGAGRIVR